MEEYLVKIRDFDQKITHVMHQLAKSQEEAEEIALDWARGALHSQNLEVVPEV